MPLTTYTAGEVLTAASLNDNFSFASSNGGLVCVKAETAFTSVSSTTADGVFTSDYTNYRIVVRFTTSTQELRMQFRAAAVDTTANYNFQLGTFNSTTPTGSRVTSASSGELAGNSSGFFNLLTLEISGPQLAEPTFYEARNGRNNGAYTTPVNEFRFGNQSDSTAFDGIKFSVVGGTTTGSYTIYGYSKTV